MAGNSKRGLDVRQKLFCYEYLQNGGNGRQAAIVAGYKPTAAHVAASRLLANDKVSAFIAEKRASLEAKHEISIDRVVAELRAILLVDPVEAFDEHGAIRPLSEWPESLRRALSGLETEERIEMTTPDNPVVVTIRKFKWWSKTEASQQLLRRLGGFKLDNEQKAATLSELLAEAHRRRLIVDGE